MQVQQMDSSSKVQSDTKMEQCILNCINCFKVCEETFARSIGETSHKKSSHLILLKSCADICQTSAKFMMMKSNFHVDTCGVCAKVCRECADSCDSLGDESMRECIDACRKCAESCGEMSKMSH
jgi:hypothetical protein